MGGGKCKVRYGRGGGVGRKGRQGTTSGQREGGGGSEVSSKMGTLKLRDEREKKAKKLALTRAVARASCWQCTVPERLS